MGKTMAELEFEEICKHDSRCSLFNDPEILNLAYELFPKQDKEILRQIDKLGGASGNIK